MFKRNESEESRKRAAEPLLESALNCGIRVFTDGAVVEATGNGGAAAVIQTRVEERIVQKAAGVFCSSDLPEMTAIDAAVEICLQLGEEHGNNISLLNDSMSSLQTLQQSPASQDSEMGVPIWRKLSQLKIPIRLNWIPAHCGIDGNERADKAAGAACALPQREVDKPLQTALAVLKRERKKDKESFREYARFSNKQEETRLERADRVTVNQFRAGASSVSKATLYIIGKTEDDACTFCGEEETEKHILQDCPRTVQAVVDLVGLMEVDLLENPKMLLQLLKKTVHANARTISPKDG